MDNNPREKLLRLWRHQFMNDLYFDLAHAGHSVETNGEAITKIDGETFSYYSSEVPPTDRNPVSGFRFEIEGKRFTRRSNERGWSRKLILAAALAQSVAQRGRRLAEERFAAAKVKTKDIEDSLPAIHQHVHTADLGYRQGNQWTVYHGGSPVEIFLRDLSPEMATKIIDAVNPILKGEK